MAFILGVCSHSWLSTGAGAVSRHELSMGVIDGMLAATVLGLPLIPAFYVSVRNYSGTSWMPALGIGRSPDANGNGAIMQSESRTSMDPTCRMIFCSKRLKSRRWSMFIRVKAILSLPMGDIPAYQCLFSGVHPCHSFNARSWSPPYRPPSLHPSPSRCRRRRNPPQPPRCAARSRPSTGTR
ncbi:hypothetical protein [Cupriavidus pampae]|uniref:hypothetical protein n=1 Tax=Cupriavidus pampae TaxID=659251 RepID=UPI001CC5BC05|nr:hypothetical protein [Cupriavidus pampae]